MIRTILLALALAAGASSAADAQTQLNPLQTPMNAFRRMTDPVMVTVGPTAQPTMVPDGKLIDTQSGLRLGSFYVVNPNNVWVRLRGFSAQNVADCTAVGVTPSTGWLWPPGHVAVYSTQTPACVSAMAVPMPGFPITGTTTYAPIELSYGFGQ
jgi:hypothetical protein